MIGGSMLSRLNWQGAALPHDGWRAASMVRGAIRL
jgi:hypothetical protein